MPFIYSKQELGLTENVPFTCIGHIYLQHIANFIQHRIATTPEIINGQALAKIQITSSGHYQLIITDARDVTPEDTKLLEDFQVKLISAIDPKDRVSSPKPRVSYTADGSLVDLGYTTQREVNYPPLPKKEDEHSLKNRKEPAYENIPFPKHFYSKQSLNSRKSTEELIPSPKDIHGEKFVSPTDSRKTSEEELPSFFKRNLGYTTNFCSTSSISTPLKNLQEIAALSHSEKNSDYENNPIDIFSISELLALKAKRDSFEISSIESESSTPENRRSTCFLESEETSYTHTLPASAYSSPFYEYNPYDKPPTENGYANRDANEKSENSHASYASIRLSPKPCEQTPIQPNLDIDSDTEEEKMLLSLSSYKPEKGFLDKAALQRLPTTSTQSALLCFPYLSQCSVDDIVNLIEDINQFLAYVGQENMGVLSILTYDSVNKCNLIYLEVDSNPQSSLNEDPFDESTQLQHEISQQEIFTSTNYKPFNYSSDHIFAKPSQFGSKILFNALFRQMHFSSPQSYPSEVFRLDSNQLKINDQIPLHNLNFTQLLELESFLKNPNTKFFHISVQKILLNPKPMAVSPSNLYLSSYTPITGYIDKVALNRLPPPSIQSALLCFPYLSACSVDNIIHLINDMNRFLSTLNRSDIGILSVLTYDSLNHCNVLFVEADFNHQQTKDPFHESNIHLHEISQQRTFLESQSKATKYIYTPFNYASSHNLAQPSHFSTQIVLKYLLSQMYFREEISYPSEAFHIISHQLKMKASSHLSANHKELLELELFLRNTRNQISHISLQETTSRSGVLHRMLVATEKPENSYFQEGIHIFLPIGVLRDRTLEKIQHFERMLEIFRNIYIKSGRDKSTFQSNFCQLGFLSHPDRPSELLFTEGLFDMKDGILASLDLKKSSAFSLLKRHNQAETICRYNFAFLIYFLFTNFEFEFIKESPQSINEFVLNSMRKIFFIEQVSHISPKFRITAQMKLFQISIQQFTSIIDFLKSSHLVIAPIPKHYKELPPLNR